jgi:hypothetical protein
LEEAKQPETTLTTTDAYNNSVFNVFTIPENTLDPTIRLPPTLTQHPNATVTNLLSSQHVNEYNQKICEDVLYNIQTDQGKQKEVKDKTMLTDIQTVALDLAVSGEDDSDHNVRCPIPASPHMISQTAKHQPSPSTSTQTANNTALLNNQVIPNHTATSSDTYLESSEDEDNTKVPTSIDIPTPYITGMVINTHTKIQDIPLNMQEEPILERLERELETEMIDYDLNNQSTPESTPLNMSVSDTSTQENEDIDTTHRGDMEDNDEGELTPYPLLDPRQTGSIPSLTDLCVRLLPNRSLQKFGVRAIPKYLPTTLVKDYDTADNRYSKSALNKPTQLDDINKMGGRQYVIAQEMSD